MMPLLKGLPRRIRSLILRMNTLRHQVNPRVRLGKGTVIHPGARLVTRGGSITLGRNCEVHSGAIVTTYGGEIALGDNCSVNHYSVLYGHGGLTIGNDVRIAGHCVIIPANHGIDADLPISRQPLSRQGIRISNDVWLGSRVTVLDGVSVPEGCVLAAGAVVTPSSPLEAFGIFGGIPARKIGERPGLRAS